MTPPPVELDGGRPLQTGSTPWLSPRVAAVLIVLAGLLAYWNSFQGAFIFDDLAIRQNQTIRHLWPPGPALLIHEKGIPLGSTVMGRPLLNYSFAVNYAFGELDLWGFHATNLAIHILAGLALFGIVRRTLLLPLFRERFEGRETGLSLAVALLWLVHPLQTESVTYIVQRAESLAGLFYLATLYFAVRGFEEKHPIKWYAAATGACFLGMGVKETVASAPFMVFLYDALFIAGSFRETLRKRWRFYAALLLACCLLAALVLREAGRGGTVGFGHGISPWQYARVQFGAIAHYLKLVFWPNPLVFDYGSELPAGPWLPYAILIGALVAGTVVALRLQPWLGYLGVWFFLILAPTSSVIPVVTQVMAEHRMYLPLAAVAVLAVIGTDWIWRRQLSKSATLSHWKPAACIPAVVTGALVVLLGCVTAARNTDYQSAFGLWKDTLSKWPQSSRAEASVGEGLAARGRYEEAIPHFRRALAIKPKFSEAFFDLGSAFAAEKKIPQALVQFREALKLRPDYAEVHYNLGLILASEGKPSDAADFFQRALDIKPDFQEAEYNLAVVLASQKKTAEAETHFRRAIEIEPNYPEAHFDLGALLVSQGKTREAIGHYLFALQFMPNDEELQINLGNAYALQGNLDEAILHYRRGLELNPDSKNAHFNLGKILQLQGKTAEASEQLRRAEQLGLDDSKPDPLKTQK